MTCDLVIEHLEEHFSSWWKIEYERVAAFIEPKGHRLLITNAAQQEMPTRANVVCHKGHVNETLPFDRVCLLDSEAPETLSPADAPKFDYFLLGGILGNVDEFDFDRTSVLRDLGYPRRNLGNMQMTTDTAAMVTSLIVHEEVPFEQLQFIDRPEFPIAVADASEDSKESLIMNFRYLVKPDGSPDIDPHILDMAIKDRDFSLVDDLE